MPIKKRSDLATPKPTAKPTPAAKPKANPAPEPKPKRKLNVKRRSSFGGDKPKPHVYIDPIKNILVVRTPAACTKWDQDFRMRIVRDYVPPRTLRQTAEHQRLLSTVNDEDRTYRIGGQLVRVRQPTEDLDQNGYVVVLRTDVQNISKGTQLFLNHPDPAMRMLMVYSFLTSIEIGGTPDLQIAPIS